MPNCWQCNRPIIFVDFRPSDKTGETPKSVPIDIEPNPDGSIILYQFPTLRAGLHGDELKAAQATQKTFARRCYGRPYLDYYRALGGKIYKIHFDTCPARNRRRD